MTGLAWLYACACRSIILLHAWQSSINLWLLKDYDSWEGAWLTQTKWTFASKIDLFLSSGRSGNVFASIKVEFFPRWWTEWYFICDCPCTSWCWGANLRSGRILALLSYSITLVARLTWAWYNLSQGLVPAANFAPVNLAIWLVF